MIIPAREPPHEYLLWRAGTVQFKWGWQSPSDAPFSIEMTPDLLRYAFREWQVRGVSLPMNTNHESPAGVTCDLQLRANDTEMWLAPMRWPENGADTQQVSTGVLRYVSPEWELIWDEQIEVINPAIPPHGEHASASAQEQIVHRKLVGIVLHGVALTSDPATLNVRPLLPEQPALLAASKHGSRSNRITLSINQKENPTMAKKTEPAPDTEPKTAAPNAASDAAPEPKPEPAPEADAAPDPEPAAAPEQGDPEANEDRHMAALDESIEAGMQSTSLEEMREYLATAKGVLAAMKIAQDQEHAAAVSETDATKTEPEDAEASASTSPFATEVEADKGEPPSGDKEIAKAIRSLYGKNLSATKLAGMLLAREADHTELHAAKTEAKMSNEKATTAELDALRTYCKQKGADERTVTALVKAGSGAMRAFLAAREAATPRASSVEISSNGTAHLPSKIGSKTDLSRVLADANKRSEDRILARAKTQSWHKTPSK